MYLMLNWTNVIVTAILGGEPHSYNTFAGLTHHPSRHGHGIICYVAYVSTIQECADISHRHLSNCGQHFRWSDRCNNNVAYFCNLVKTVVRLIVTPKGSDTESLCFSIADNIYDSSKLGCLQFPLVSFNR
jgi:hypothetical protein